MSRDSSTTLCKFIYGIPVLMRELVCGAFRDWDKGSLVYEKLSSLYLLNFLSSLAACKLVIMHPLVIEAFILLIVRLFE